MTLLAFYYTGRKYVKNRFLKASLIIYIPVTPVHANKTGSLWVKIGTLFVFVSNIVTIELVIIAAISPTTSRSLAWVSVGLPRWVNFSGSILLVLDAVWDCLRCFSIQTTHQCFSR